jgi:hypothetical protein
MKSYWLSVIRISDLAAARISNNDPDCYREMKPDYGTNFLPEQLQSFFR